MSAIPSLIAVVNRILMKNSESKNSGKISYERSCAGSKFIVDAIVWLEEREKEREKIKEFRFSRNEEMVEREKRYSEKTLPKSIFFRLCLLSICPYCGGMAVNYAGLKVKDFVYGGESTFRLTSSRHRKYDCKRCGKVELNFYYHTHWMLWQIGRYADIRFEFFPQTSLFRTYKEIILNDNYRIISRRVFGCINFDKKKYKKTETGWGGWEKIT